MSGLRELPLFPLNTVLFPGMPLPLHIFEPRYKTMINQSVQEASPFGVVLIRHGQEVGGSSVPYDVGTSAFVTQVERLPGGRMNINTVGFQRFRIRELRHDKSYLVGLVEDFPLDATETPGMASLVDVVRERVRHYLSVLVDVLDTAYDFANLPDDPAALAFFAAIVLNVPAADKQTLLAIPDLGALLDAEASLLTRESDLLAFMARHERLTQDRPTSFSDS